MTGFTGRRIWYKRRKDRLGAANAADGAAAKAFAESVYDQPAVILAEKPLECVAIGAGRYYEVNRMINQGRSLYDSLNS